MLSYLWGLFDNLMEGGEDAGSTTMAVKGERGGGEMADGQTDGQVDGHTDRETDRQTDQESVQIQEYGVQIHTGRQVVPSGG